MSPRDDFWNRKFPRTMLVLKRVWFVIITIVTITVTVLALIDLINPASNGAAGSVVITRCEDIGTHHDCYGDFVSNDRRVRFADALVAGAGNARPAQRFAGFGDANDKSITVPSGSERWTDIGVMLVFWIAWSVLFCFVVYLPLRRRRTARQAATT